MNVFAISGFLLRILLHTSVSFRIAYFWAYKQQKTSMQYMRICDTFSPFSIEHNYKIECRKTLVAKRCIQIQSAVVCVKVGVISQCSISSWNVFMLHVCVSVYIYYIHTYIHSYLVYGIMYYILLYLVLYYPPKKFTFMRKNILCFLNI